MYETENSAGMDIKAYLPHGPQSIQPFGRVLIPTGLYIELPEGYEAQIRSRSGLALKKGLMVLNSPGTIDSDYRGQIAVILANMSNVPVTIEDGDRIAQMVINRYEQAKWEEVDVLSPTARGIGGFGHTGV